MLPNRSYHSLLSDCSSLTRVADSSPTPFSSLDPSLPRLVRHWQAGCESSSCCGLGALLGAGGSCASPGTHKLFTVFQFLLPRAASAASSCADRPVLSISIPVFSRRSDSFLKPIEIAPFRSSDPTPSSRSDLRYAPTLRTYLHYERSYLINVFFIRSFGEPRLRFGLPAKASVFSRRSP